MAIVTDSLVGLNTPCAAPSEAPGPTRNPHGAQTPHHHTEQPRDHLRAAPEPPRAAPGTHSHAIPPGHVLLGRRTSHDGLRPVHDRYCPRTKTTQRRLAPIPRELAKALGTRMCSECHRQGART